MQTPSVFPDCLLLKQTDAYIVCPSVSPGALDLPVRTINIHAKK